MFSKRSHFCCSSSNCSVGPSQNRSYSSCCRKFVPCVFVVRGQRQYWPFSLPLLSDVVLNPEFTRDWSERMSVSGDRHPSYGLNGLFSPGPVTFDESLLKTPLGKARPGFDLAQRYCIFCLSPQFFWQETLLLIMPQPFVHAVHYFGLFVCSGWTKKGFLNCGGRY